MNEAPHDPARTKRLVVRAAIVAVGAIVALNLIAYALDATSGARRGPESSSYTTAESGLAAYADLLARAGHPVERLRSDISEDPPAPHETLVLVDPGPVVAEEARALRSFVRDGGRLVTGGASAPGWLEDVVVAVPEWEAGGAPGVDVVAPAPEVAGLDEVNTDARGTWSDPASGLPVLGAEGEVTATVESVGAGRVVMLADASILHNDLLATADNAAFALQAAGEGTRPVVFAESVHGYGEAGGVGAVPDRWLWALGGLFVATLVYMLARGRRLGPPEEPGRPLPPPRKDYVDALGGILARTREPAAVASKLRSAVKRRVAARAALAADAPDDVIVRAAGELGLSQRQLGALERDDATEEDLVALGRALAALERRGTRGEEIGVST